MNCLVLGAAPPRYASSNVYYFFSAVELKDWQKQVVEKMEGQDDRQILFIVDEQGGTGKSFLASWLNCMKGAVIFENGRTADIKYSYDGNNYVIFDFVRSSQDHLNYEVIECIKNRRFFSTKYESIHKNFLGDGVCKIVVMMNEEPDYSKLSEDRFMVYKVNGLGELCYIK